MKTLQAFKQRHGHDIGGVRPVMIPDDAGEWVSRHDAEHQIEHISAQRDKLLAALEDVIAMARSLGDVQSEYIEEAVSEFIEGDIEDLITSIKGGAIGLRPA